VLENENGFLPALDSDNENQGAADDNEDNEEGDEMPIDANENGIHDEGQHDAEELSVPEPEPEDDNVVQQQS